MSLGHVDDAQFQQFASRVRQKIDSGYVKQELGKSSKRIGTQSLGTDNNRVDMFQYLKNVWLKIGCQDSFT